MYIYRRVLEIVMVLLFLIANIPKFFVLACLIDNEYGIGHRKFCFSIVSFLSLRIFVFINYYPGNQYACILYFGVKLNLLRKLNDNWNTVYDGLVLHSVKFNNGKLGNVS